MKLEAGKQMCAVIWTWEQQLDVSILCNAKERPFFLAPVAVHGVIALVQIAKTNFKHVSVARIVRMWVTKEKLAGRPDSGTHSQTLARPLGE